VNVSGPRGGRHAGFTLAEVVIVAGILVLALSLGLMSYQNANRSTMMLAGGFEFQIRLRQASDRLMEHLCEGTEVVQPVSGMTLPFLVIKDITNALMVVYLEKAPDKTPGPYICVCSIDRLTGTPDPKERKVLFDGVKALRFTAPTPGLVMAHVTLANPAGQELAGLVEVPMKNVEGLDP